MTPYIPFVKLSEKHLDKELCPISFYPAPYWNDEVFKPLIIPDNPNIMKNRYFISNYGRIWDSYAESFLTTFYDDNVAIACYLSNGSIDFKKYRLGRLVLYNFNYIHGCENMKVYRKDGNILNCRLDNLQWVSSENTAAYSMKDNRLKTREYLTYDQLKCICEMLQNRESILLISKQTGVNVDTIIGIATRKIEPEFSKQYDFGNVDLDSARKINKALDDKTVHEICKCIENGEKEIDICRKFNIGRHIISGIRHKRSYAHISSQYNFPEIQKMKSMTSKDVERICELLSQGVPKYKIAEITGFSEFSIRAVVTDEKYARIASKYNLKPVQEFRKRIDENTIRKICVLLESTDMSDKEIADKLNILWYNVRDVRLRRSFTNISKDYIW